MNVQVMSREQARRFSYKPQNRRVAVISISDPDNRPPIFNYHCFMSVLYLYFWDEEEDENGCMTEDDANSIACFLLTEDRPIDLLIVHCEAGVSRSAGVAAAILRAMTGDDSQIFDNPRYVPNRKCYRRTLNAMMNAMSISNVEKTRNG